MERLPVMTGAPVPARAALWSQLRERTKPWDLIVIGGGVTGAAVAREAARRRLAVLLIEQRDFAWGTSSRSSRMVHGGLRYLAQGNLKLTRDAVRERERLLREAPGLVDPMRFVFPHRRFHIPGRWSFGALLTLYDLYAGRRDHGFMDPAALKRRVPFLHETGLTGATYYTDAVTDDARLVLRLLQEARADGAAVINYAAADALLRAADGTVTGVRVRDHIGGDVHEVRARSVINATGVWADGVRAAPPNQRTIRALRGSHLVFPGWRLPVFACVALLHPRDRRLVFIIPWDGTTIVGTTDLDHDRGLADEPRISQAEVAYLLEVLASTFPALNLGAGDAIASYAGVRAVIGTGRDPSKERRDHALWRHRGLVTVTGGKLTTCRLIALDALHAAGMLETDKRDAADAPLFRPVAPQAGDALSAPQWRRLTGRYGAAAADIVAGANAGELEAVPGTRTLWAELRWCAGHELVAHLDDLLLRRTRLGLLLPEGADAQLAAIRAICQPVLGWDDRRWAAEVQAYRTLWRSAYSVPEVGHGGG